MCVDKDKKLQVHTILRAKKRLLEYLKIKKRYGIVTFVSMNSVKNYALKPLNMSVQHWKQPPVR